MQLEVFWPEIVWSPGLLERKNNNKVESLFDVIFYVYTHVDNRERIRESVQNKGDEFRWKKSMKLSWRRCREKMRNVSGQQEAASKVKKKGVVEKQNRT